MALKGYHSYRGRQGAWRWLLAIVLVLVLIAACAFLLLQRYIVYSDDGSFYLDLPFELNWNLPLLSGGSNSEGTQNEQDFNLVVDPPQNEQDDPSEQNPPNDSETGPEPPASETYIARRLITLPQVPVDEAELDSMLTAAGADGFVFRAKGREGYVYYQSGAASPDAVVADSISQEVLARLCAREGVYTVARISCMRDSIYALNNYGSAGICQGEGYNYGYIWYEHDWNEHDKGGHWLDAEKQAARDYIIGLAVECAQLGFDELLLENVCYPYRGNLHKIDYSKNTMSKTDALVLFLEELEAALEPYGVKVTLVLEENEVRGLADNTEHTGFDPQRLLPLVDAVYVSTRDAETTRHEMGILLSGQNVPVLVPIVTELGDGESWYLDQ